jgi:hypothetical protein
MHHHVLHVRWLVLSSLFLAHPRPLDIPVFPGFSVELQSGTQFGYSSYPRRYAIQDRPINGAILFVIRIPF